MGLLFNGDVFGGSMVEVVVEGILYLIDVDREVIVIYLFDFVGSGDILEFVFFVMEILMVGMDYL